MVVVVVVALVNVITGDWPELVAVGYVSDGVITVLTTGT